MPSARAPVRLAALDDAVRLIDKPIEGKVLLAADDKPHLARLFSAEKTGIVKPIAPLPQFFAEKIPAVRANDLA